MRAGRRGERGVGLTELSCSACCRVGRSRVAHHTSAMRHLCVVLTLHWLSIRYTAFILWICTCHGGSSSCTRPSTWLRNHSVSLRTWSRQAGQQGQGRGRRGFHLRGRPPPATPGSAAAAAAGPRAGPPLAPGTGRHGSGSWKGKAGCVGQSVGMGAGWIWWRDIFGPEAHRASKYPEPG
jgi:hypothetical protein